MQPEVINPESTPPSPVTTPPQTSIPSSQPALAPSQPPTTKKGHLSSITKFILFIVIVALCAGGVYYWQHKKVNSLNTQVVSLNSQVSKLNKQVIGLQSNKTTKATTSTTTTTTTTNPYAGWKTYTLPQEKLTFMYPSSWSLATYADSPTQGDAVNLTGSNNATLSIDVGAGNASFNCPNGGCNITYADPVTFVGQKAYLDSFSGSGSNPVTNTELSMSNSVVSSKQFFAARNVVAPAEDQSTATIAIAYNYRGSSGQDSNTEPLSYILSDQNYKDAKLIIESMSY